MAMDCRSYLCTMAGVTQALCYKPICQTHICESFCEWILQTALQLPHSLFVVRPVTFAELFALFQPQILLNSSYSSVHTVHVRL